MQMNEAQQSAVLHRDGPMLVIAGPGSGKTLVITERIKYLIEQCQVPAGQLLVITFTKAAAGEMKERFLANNKSTRTGVSFGTFHAVFFTILKHAYHLTAANIIREEIKYQYMKDIVHQMKLEFEDEKEFVSDLFSEISLVKGSRMDLTNYYSLSCPDEIFRKIYREYDNRLRRANLIDFDDMLIMCHELLTQRPDILALWQNKYRYIMVDEFQDINIVQYEIVRLLAKPEDNLFIVGDDDQSIYRFRGAKPEIMLNFPKDYPNCNTITLNHNYRSTPNIMQASNRLVLHNMHRFTKSPVAVKKDGVDVIIRHFATLTEENQALAEELQYLIKKGVRLSRIAILVRTALGTGPLLHKLMEYNIPFQMRDKLPNLFDHWIAIDIISYIKISLGETERSLYLRIINRPKRYLSRDCFDSATVDWEAVRDYYEDKSWVLERLDQLEYDLSLLHGMTPYAAINYIRRGIGYEDYLKEYAQQRRMKAEELMDILDELQDSSRSHKTYEDWFGYIDQYKEELKKQASGYNSHEKDRVVVATMHGSKGLEFETVFIIDANEGIIPHKKAVIDSDIEEERRLFYVAMTRAKEQLYLFSARERYNKTAQRSRFIDEICEQS